jgi:epoxyqueuosine reductase
MPTSIFETSAPISLAMAETLKQTIAEEAKAAGFDAVRFTSADAVEGAGEALAAFLAEGRQGDMGWLATTAERRKDPSALWPEAKTVIVCGLNYGRTADPLAVLAEKSRGAISIYAQGDDYHDVLKAKLKPLAARVQQFAGGEVKIFVDTAPVMEKPLAARAGLGWQGKHTNLVSREFGSWLFIGSIFTTAEIAPDAPEEDHCGACRRCLDICPTRAFTAPYRIDARACISYLTIEHKGHIAPHFRAAMGNRIFGCDDCLAVCPWNKFAQDAREAKLSARAASVDPPLAELLVLDDAAFRVRFGGTPIKRTGRDRFLRNVLIATGNSGDASFAPLVEGRLNDPSPLVRAMAVWALARLSPLRFRALRRARFAEELDQTVRGEWMEEAA